MVINYEDYERIEYNPWELLRELYHACRYLRKSSNNDGNEEIMMKTSAAIRQHDSKIKADNKICEYCESWRKRGDYSEKINEALRIDIAVLKRRLDLALSEINTKNSNVSNLDLTYLVLLEENQGRAEASVLPSKTLDALVKAKLVTINDNVVIISHMGQDVADEMIYFGKIAFEKYRELYE
jgi:hypothetical protein